MKKLKKSVEKMWDTLDSMDKHEDYLKRQIDIAQQRAKEKAKKGDKRAALFELKKKKKYEKDLEMMFGKRANLESQTMALNNARHNQEILASMKAGHKALASVVSEKSFDNIADIMDDIDESIGFAAELDEVLAVPTFDSIYDADDVEDELADLEKEMEDVCVERPTISSKSANPIRKKESVMQFNQRQKSMKSRKDEAEFIESNLQ